MRLQQQLTILGTIQQFLIETVILLEGDLTPILLGESLPLQFLLGDVLGVVHPLPLLDDVLDDLLLNDDLFGDFLLDVDWHLDDLFDATGTGVVLPTVMAAGPPRALYFPLSILFLLLCISVAPDLIIDLELSHPPTLLRRGHDLRPVDLHTLLMDCNAHLSLQAPLLTRLPSLSQSHLLLLVIDVDRHRHLHNEVLFDIDGHLPDDGLDLFHPSLVQGGDDLLATLQLHPQVVQLG